MRNKWRRMEERCPFQSDECDIDPCTDFTIVDGEFVKGEPIEGKFWCRNPECPLVGSCMGPSAKQLWKAYKAKKIRFAVDMHGNPTTTIMRTGQTLRSENLTQELYDFAVEGVKPYRDKTGLRIDRDWCKRK